MSDHAEDAGRSAGGITEKPHTVPGDRELQFYYFGLYRVLTRYRAMTILGWVIVALGFASVPFGWSLGRPNGFLEIALSACTIVAGIGLVQNSVTSLDAYIKVPFAVHADDAGAPPPSLVEIREMITEIDLGGWQEAYAAIGKMEEMKEKFGLPRLT